MKNRKPQNKSMGPTRNKRSSKSKGSRAKDDRRVERNGYDSDETRSDRLSPLNDFSWYNRNPNLTVAAASIPFPYRPGMKMPFTATDVGLQPYNIPGVMELNWAPTVGQSSTATDPASIAAKEVFARVRSAFSGSIEADPPDFIMYFLALDSIFSYIGALKRVYRILNAYTPENYCVPDTILAALGLPEAASVALKADRMKLYQVINELVGMTRKFRCPAVFDLFNRHYWMNDNVYTDAAMPNSQMYLFRQMYYLQYTMAETPDKVLAGAVKYVNTPFNSTTDVDSLFTFGRSLIDALANSDDAYIISGYLTRAYESAPVFAVDELRVDEVFNPVYVPEVLAQIENSYTVNTFGTMDFDTFVITQDPKTNAILSNPRVKIATLNAATNPFLSIRSMSPSVPEVVEATRLKASIDAQGNVICATEIPITWNLYTGTDAQNPVGAFAYPMNTYWDSSTTVDTNFMAGIMVGTQFDWAPIATVEHNMGGSAGSRLYFIGDLHNFTMFTAEVLANLHKICLYSEFNSFNQAGV